MDESGDQGAKLWEWFGVEGPDSFEGVLYLARQLRALGETKRPDGASELVRLLLGLCPG